MTEKVGKVTLDLFWKLSEAKDGTRLDAAFRLLDQVSQNEDEKMVNYVLTRLIRGLGSDRASARQGFFVALVELLRSNEDLNYERVIKVMEEDLNQKGSKSEEGELMFGRVLANGALLRSAKTSGSETASVFNDLFGLASKRSYLAVAAHKFVIDHLEKIEKEREFKEHLWPVVKNKCDCSTLESFWLVLAVMNKFPEVIDESFLQETFGRTKLASGKFADDFAKVLMGCTMPLHVLSNHPALESVVKTLCSNGLINKFWTEHIDPHISKDKPYKASLAFNILNIAIPLLPRKTIADFLTVHFMETALYFLSRLEASPEEDKAILDVFARLVTIAKECPETQKPILKALLTHPGNIAFDKLSGGNIVHQLTGFCDSNSVKFLGLLYRRALAGDPDSGRERQSQERVYAAHQLAKLVGHPAMQDEREWKIETLNYLLTLTLFEVKKTPIGPVTSMPLPLSREAKVEVRNTFFKALDAKAKSFEAVCSILREVVDYADRILLKSEANATPYVPLAPLTLKAWKDMIKAVQGIVENDKKESVFQLLFIHMGFQLFVQPSMAIEVLEELHICHTKSKEENQKTRKRKRTEDEAEEPNWVEVVVDLLLSLLSQNKSILRQVGSSVFSLLCPHMTTPALQAIIEVINPPVEEAEADEDDEEAEADEEDEESENESEDGEEGSEGEEEDDDEEEEEEEDENNEKIKKELKNVLGDVVVNVDEDAASVDMDDMDDEQMKKIDEALAKVFRTLTKKKGNAQKKKEQRDALALIHFRIRALDMIDIYLAHQPPMSHVITLIRPIMSALDEAIKSKDQKPLENRLKGSLRKLTNIKKPKEDKELDPAALVQALQTLVDLANSGSPLVQRLSQPIPLFAQCCTLVLRCAQIVGGITLIKIHDIYQKSLDDFFNRSHCLLPMPFFLLPIQGNWIGIWDLVEKLISSGFDPKTRQFRRTQALSLLSALFHNQTLQQTAPKEKRLRAIEILQKHLVAEIKNFSSSEEAVKPRYLCEILNVLHGLRNTCLDQVNWEIITVTLEDFREKVPKNRHFHDVKKAFNKIGVLLKIKVVQGSDKKRKSNEESEETSKPGFFGDLQEETEEQMEVENTEEKKNKKKKKKKKISKEAALKRKERKAFEIEGQFEGMEIPSFAGLAVTENMNFAIVDPKIIVEGGGEEEEKSGEEKNKKKLKKQKLKQKKAEEERSKKKKKIKLET